MIPAIRSELRKLFSVRSTLYIALIWLAALGLFAFYAEGYHQTSSINDPVFLTTIFNGAIGLVSFLIVLPCLLLVTHEYRYSTIMYTLTAARSRSHVFLAKLVVISLYAVVVSALIGSLAVLLSWAGLHVHGLSVTGQQFSISNALSHGVFYGWGSAMFGFIFAMIIRSQVGSIVAVFLVPALVEGLLGLLIKDVTKYLPYNALSQVLQSTLTGRGSAVADGLTQSNAMLVVLAYVIGGWLIAWLMFLRRDAN